MNLGALAWKWGDGCASARVEDGTVIITKWNGEGSEPTAAEIADAIAGYQGHLQVVAIKAEAGKRIFAVIPEWKQRNLTARASELAMKVAGGVSLTAEEQAEWNAGVTVWLSVKAIRAASDAIEASLAGMTAEQLAAFDPTDDAHWSQE